MTFRELGERLYGLSCSDDNLNEAKELLDGVSEEQRGPVVNYKYVSEYMK